MVSLSRRALLESFLGAAAASAACTRRAAPEAPVPGELVDSFLATGHLLREPVTALPEGAPVRRVDVLVVGAGVAGLSAAWRLAGAGVEDFLVCELMDAPGGTSRSGRSAVTAYPWGAHYLPAPLSRAGPVGRLLAQLGVLTGEDAQGRPVYAEQALIHEPEERLFYKGSWYEGLYLRAGAGPQELAELARFEAQVDALAAARDAKGRKAFSVPMATGSDDAEWTALDRQSFAQWLDAQGYRSPRLRWWADYACRDDFGATAAHVSAYAGLWYFAARHDGGGQRAAGYLSWPAGNGELVHALARAAGPARLSTSTLVTRLIPGPDGCEAWALDARTRAPQRLHAKQVVLAAPSYAAARLLPGRERAPHLAELQYGPWVVANLHVSAPPRGRGFPLAWDNVLYESQSLGYVVATHQALRQREDGPTVLTWYYPLVGEDVRAERTRLLGTTLQDWQALCLADLSLAHPGLRAQVTRLDVCRWGHAMIRPRVGFLFGGARQKAQQSVEGVIHPAHSELGGMALFEEANWYGVMAAERALAGLSRKAGSWL